MPPGAVPTIAAAVVSVLIPLLFLYVVRRLDLYASTDHRAVALCIGWGIASFGIAYAVNGAALGVLARAVVIVAVAPVAEELVKAVVLVDQVRRPSFTYFVDGAILGFAAGTGFAMIENLVYLLGAPAADGLGLSINRVFGASLMHGTACALVGVALGRWRFGRDARRAVALAGGLAAAIVLHVAFNGWTAAVDVLSPAVRVYGAIGLGLCGVAAVAAMIVQGLHEERSWLRQALAPDVGVTEAEAGAVQRLRQVRTLLAPVEAHFGAARAVEVGDLLRLQARFGLKRQAAALAPAGALKERLEVEAAALQRAMDEAQRAIGVYVMAYVRAVWPTVDDTLWARLDEAVAATDGGADNLWDTLDERAQ